MTDSTQKSKNWNSSKIFFNSKTAYPKESGYSNTKVLFYFCWKIQIADIRNISTDPPLITNIMKAIGQ